MQPGLNMLKLTVYVYVIYITIKIKNLFVIFTIYDKIRKM